MRHVKPIQERAAILAGRGWSRRAVASELGTSERSLSRWGRLPEYQLLASQVREERLRAEPPTVRAVLEAALTAQKGEGIDWQSRLTAARLLLGAPDEPSRDEPVVITRKILVDRATGEEVEAA